MTDVINADELKEKLDKNEDFLLIDVLSVNSYRVRHIPGAINVPFSGDTFPNDLEEKADIKKDDGIIVYCSSETCQASPNAAKKLEEFGYTNVKHFKDGLTGLQAAGVSLRVKIKFLIFNEIKRKS